MRRSASSQICSQFDHDLAARRLANRWRLSSRSAFARLLLRAPPGIWRCAVVCPSEGQAHAPVSASQAALTPLLILPARHSPKFLTASVCGVCDRFQEHDRGTAVPQASKWTVCSRAVGIEWQHAAPAFPEAKQRGATGRPHPEAGVGSMDSSRFVWFDLFVPGLPRTASALHDGVSYMPPLNEQCPTNPRLLQVCAACELHPRRRGGF